MYTNIVEHIAAGSGLTYLNDWFNNADFIPNYVNEPGEFLWQPGSFVVNVSKNVLT